MTGHATESYRREKREEREKEGERERKRERERERQREKDMVPLLKFRYFLRAIGLHRLAAVGRVEIARQRRERKDGPCRRSRDFNK